MNSPVVRTVLIVDDSPEDRMTYQRYLKRDGHYRYEFLEAASVGEAVKFCQLEQPDYAVHPFPNLILLDYRLPDDDGLVFLQQWQKRYPHSNTSVVVLTGQGDEQVAVEAMRLGAEDYLVKGKLTSDGLCQKIHQVLEQKQLKQQLWFQQEQQRLVNAIALRIRRSLQLDEVLQTTVDEVRQLLQCDRALIYQFAPDQSGVVTHESVLPQWSVSLNQPIRDTCFQNNGTNRYVKGWTWAVADVTTAGLAPCHLQLLERFQVKANLVVPILLEPRDTPSASTVTELAPKPTLWGLLVIHQCDRPRQWQPSELDLVNQLAVQLAIAIHQSSLYAQLQALNADLEQKVQARTAELAASEQRFRGIFNNTFQFTGLLTPEGTLLEANQTALDFGGFTREQAVGNPFWEAPWWQISPATQNQLQQAIARAAQGEFIRYEVDVLGKGGQIATLDFSLRPLFNDAGEVSLLIPEGRDISDHKQLELALKASEAELRGLFNAMVDLVIIVDQQGHILKITPNKPDKLYQPVQDILGKSIHEVFPKPIADQFLQVVQQTLTQRQTLEYEYSLPIGDQELWFHAKVSPISGDTVAWVARDISDRKQLELELQASQAKLNDIFNTAGAVLTRFRLFADQTWQEEFYSAGSTAILGYSPEELCADHNLWLSRVHPEDVQQVLLPALAQARHETNLTIEIRFQHKNNSWRWLSETLVSKRDEAADCWIVTCVEVDITDRKQAEQAFQESQILLQLVMHSLPQAIFWKDRNSRFLGCNRQLIADAGLSSADEIIGKTDFEMPWREQASLYQADDDIVMESGQPKLNIEEPITKSENCLRWLKTNKLPLRSSTGEIIGVLGSYEDITEQKSNEATLKLQAQMLDQIHDAVVSTTPDGTIEAWNLSAQRLYGYTADEAIGQNIRMLYFPEDLVQLETEIVQPLLANGSHEIECRNYTKSGQEIYVSVRLSVVRDESGQPIRLLGCSNDISDRKQAEFILQKLNQELEEFNQELENRVQQRTATLQEREEQLRNLSDRLELAVQSAAIGIWDWDIVHNILNWDERMYELYGISAEQFTHVVEAWSSRIHPEDQLRVITAIEQALQGQQDYNIEFRVIHPDGAIRHLKAYGLVKRNSQGEPQRMIGINYDFSDRKQAEEELQKVNERLTLTNTELYRATRLKDEFLANMSHELRTPLNAILGMSEGLQECIFGPLTEHQKTAISSIERSGQHLLELINDILDLAKVESGKLELQLASVEVSYLCTSSLNFVRQQALAKNIQLTLELPFNLSPIEADELRLRQVLINLLSNAVKFTPNDGKVKLEVRHEVIQNQDFLYFSIIDTGIGIAEEHIDKLFKPFTQIDSRLNRQHTGTGLGLSLVRRLVELHQGTVAVTSQVNKGSCFTVRLPYHISKSAQRELEGSQKLSSAIETPYLTPPASSIYASNHPSTTTLPALILLVEDNEANAVTVSSYLQARGYRLILAKNGEEAISMATTQNPQLILMDIQMPGMDGLETTARLREYPQLKQTPIIAVTALAMSGDQEKCLAAGADDYVTKPIKLKQLVNVIQKWLHQV